VSACGGITGCNYAANADAIFSIDVIPHMTEEEIVSLLLKSKNKEHYAIFHDYLNYDSKAVPRQIVLNGVSTVMWTRIVDGHNDPQPDLLQPWLLQGGFTALGADGVPYRVVAKAEGPVIGNMTWYKLCIDPSVRPVDTPILDTTWDDFSSNLVIGVFKFQPSVRTVGSSLVTEVIVGKNHAFTKTGTAKLTIVDRKTLEAAKKALALRPVTAGTDRTARNKVWLVLTK
jgi:hypothetical protein